MVQTKVPWHGPTDLSDGVHYHMCDGRARPFPSFGLGYRGVCAYKFHQVLVSLSRDTVSAGLTEQGLTDKPGMRLAGDVAGMIWGGARPRSKDSAESLGPKLCSVKQSATFRMESREFWGTFQAEPFLGCPTWC